jgi:type I restriction enzyme S subunit
MATYENYKYSGVKWLGEIPSHWKVKNMREFFRERKSLSKDGKETLLSVSEYTGITKSITESGENKSRSKSLVGYKKCNEGDLIINIMLAWKRGLGVSPFNGIVSPSYCVFSTNNINAQYANYLLRTDTYIAEFKRHSTGIIESRLRMYPDEFKNIRCIFPPLEEQESIVAYLDKETSKIDKAIEAQQNLINTLNERKQIIISHVVSNGLDKNVKLKDTGIDWLGQIPDGWEINKLKALAEIKGRIGFRGYTNQDLVDKGEGAITLSPSNIVNGKMNFLKCSYLSWFKYYESPEIMVKNGNILFVKTGSSYGKTAFVNNLPMEATINPQFSLIKALNINPEFLNFAITSNYFKLQVERGVIGSTIPTISQSAIKNMVILVPPIEEQHAIVTYLSSLFSNIDRIITKSEEMIALLQERKQIIINEVVTGKKKVI